MPSPSFIEDQEAKIASHGHMVVGVFGDEDSPTFAYTIGLQQRGWPELILMGVRYEYAGVILNSAVQHYAALEKSPAAGDLLETLGNWPMFVGQVTPEKVREYLCQAVYRADRRGEDAPEALHLIFPDRRGCWPTDPEYDHEYMDRGQKCLAPGGEWVCPTTRAKETHFD